MKEPEEKEIPQDKTNWKKVYGLVIGWFIFFTLLMYLFTIYTA